ncbi:MAG: histidinol-phosphate transaminase [Proteobacteria bacterium]|nr:histidinol-phosphate transaminase [Pseudomonadota bacterium]
MTLTPRPGILEVTPYVGGEASISGRNRAIRLASNENPLGASPRAAAAYAALRDELHRYPDGAARELRETIARVEELDPARIVCGAGSDELIALLVRGYAGPGDEVLHSEHGFLMYPIAARTAGASPVAAPERKLRADVDALLERVTAKTRLLFLANPNNPTGSYLSEAELRRLREGLPERVLLVVDSAYAEYVTEDDYGSGAGLVEAFDNVVMTRTFSKIHGLAALRLGWAYCPPAVAGVLDRLRGPFNVSQAAQAAGVAALGDRDHVAHSRRHNARWRAWLIERLAALYLHPYPSAANFVLVRFPGHPERSADAALADLKENGVLVRALAAYGLPDCLRITIGTEAEVRATAEALEGFVARDEAGERA